MLKRTLRKYKRKLYHEKGGMMGRGSPGRESVNAPPPLKRSLSCSHLIYNSLHNDEDKKE